MGNINLITLGIIVVTIIVSWQGWQNPTLFHRLQFQMKRILIDKEYDRLITSGFLHADTFHLFFNMFTLYIFSPVILSSVYFSSLGFLLLYLASILVGSLLTIAFHKNNLGYAAIGASGGVSGILFSAIIIYPNMELSFLLFPFFGIQAWVFGIGYLAYSIFGMKTSMGNIGHAAHLGGALAGILITILVFPHLINSRMYYLLGMMIPMSVLGYLAWKDYR